MTEEEEAWCVKQQSTSNPSESEDDDTDESEGDDIIRLLCPRHRERRYLDPKNLGSCEYFTLGEIRTIFTNLRLPRGLQQENKGSGNGTNSCAHWTTRDRLDQGG